MSPTPQMTQPPLNYPGQARSDPGHGGSRRARVRDRPGRPLPLGEPRLHRALRRPARPAVRGQRGAGAQAGSRPHELRSQDRREDDAHLRPAVLDHAASGSRLRITSAPLRRDGEVVGVFGDRHADGADARARTRSGARRPDAAPAGGAAAAEPRGSRRRRSRERLGSPTRPRATTSARSCVRPARILGWRRSLMGFRHGVVARTQIASPDQADPQPAADE